MSRRAGTADRRTRRGIRRRFACLGAVLFCTVVVSDRAGAQRIEMIVGDTRTPLLSDVGSTAIPVSVDLSAAPGINVAAVQLRLMWNAEVLRIDSVRVTPGSGFVLTQNISALSDGRLVFNLFRPDGMSASGPLVWLYAARRPIADAPRADDARATDARLMDLRVTVDALGDQDGRDLRAWLRLVRVVLCGTEISC